MVTSDELHARIRLYIGALGAFAVSAIVAIGTADADVRVIKPGKAFSGEPVATVATVVQVNGAPAVAEARLENGVQIWRAIPGGAGRFDALEEPKLGVVCSPDTVQNGVRIINKPFCS
ncbi:MAG: hypothetical protein AAGK23_04820 [Pseudomonadota bacterium]